MKPLAILIILLSLFWWEFKKTEEYCKAHPTIYRCPDINYLAPPQNN
jgi:hypothetical protein